MTPPNTSASFPSTAAILAGGLGTRLRPVCDGLPKVLAPIAGVPFISFLLEYLAAQDIRQVVLCTGHLGEQISAFVADGQRWGLSVTYSHETVPLGTGGALRQAVDSISSPFFALNGDTLCHVDLRALWNRHAQHRADATLTLMEVRDGHERGCVELDAGDRIVTFREKVQATGRSLVSAGIYVIEPSALTKIGQGRFVSLEHEVFPALALAGKLFGHLQSEYFADIGTPAALRAFESDVASRCGQHFARRAAGAMATSTVN